MDGEVCGVRPGHVWLRTSGWAVAVAAGSAAAQAAPRLPWRGFLPANVLCIPFPVYAVFPLDPVSVTHLFLWSMSARFIQ
eukprot:4891622-Pyramimonas_sp.AAC.1